ncbi:hypothetical protein L7F22_047501 [Adiantum nelumboides]|nr:hypothetical protein [Adiantum nelumboides]
MATSIYNLFIVNKSGGLIFYKDYGSTGRLDTNDSLRLASLWHSMHAISQQLSPTTGCGGIEFLEADTFDLRCFQSLTGPQFTTLIFCVLFFSLKQRYRVLAERNSLCVGSDEEDLAPDWQPKSGTKFFVVAEPGTQGLDTLLKNIYDLYVDNVLKNPFYEVEMPIRCELFDLSLTQYIRKDKGMLSSR